MSWWQIALTTFVPVAALLVVGLPLVYMRTRIQKGRSHNRPESRIEVVQEPTEYSTEPEPLEKMEPLDPELIAEIEENYRIASNAVAGKFVPFKTDLWNINKQNITNLTSKLKGELVQVYIDVGLANNIVWMASEFNFKSDNLDNQYNKLCGRIATRLDGIIPSLKQSLVSPE